MSNRPHLRSLADRVGILPAYLDVTNTRRITKDATRIALLRILQEALLNARKHARAQQMVVALSFDDNTLRLIVKDDGQGFSPGELRTRSPEAGGAGLQAMRARARALGGEFKVQTRPGQGTRVEASIPISK